MVILVEHKGAAVPCVAVHSISVLLGPDIRSGPGSVGHAAIGIGGHAQVGVPHALLATVVADGHPVVVVCPNKQWVIPDLVSQYSEKVCEFVVASQLPKGKVKKFGLRLGR